MRIAVACEGENVSGHFGHCAEFRIFTVEDKEITDSELVVNPGHKKGFLPNFLNDKGVETIIAGGMGQGAREIFSDKKIEIITGASGNAEKAVKDYIAGTLATNDETCQKHDYRNECEEHEHNNDGQRHEHHNGCEKREHHNGCERHDRNRGCKH